MLIYVLIADDDNAPAPVGVRLDMDGAVNEVLSRARVYLSTDRDKPNGDPALLAVGDLEMARTEEHPAGMVAVYITYDDQPYIVGEIRVFDSEEESGLWQTYAYTEPGPEAG